MTLGIGLSPFHPLRLPKKTGRPENRATGRGADETAV
jgi:hypothetical protein